MDLSKISVLSALTRRMAWLARRLEDPEGAVTGVTLYLIDATEQKNLDSTVAINFLPKPFSLAQLAQSVKDTLAAAGD